MNGSTRFGLWGNGRSDPRARRTILVTFHGDITGGTAVPAEDFGFQPDADAPHATPVHAGLSDAGLMERVAQGCEDAFGLLVDRHMPALYRVAARMLGDGHEAEDVVQDCFARMWQHAPRWSATGAGLVGWLHRVTMNLCFDRKRRFRVVTTPELPDMADETPLVDAQIESDEAHRAVSAALDDLPERYRAALVLCYYEGFSNALAAEVMDLNIKAMESLLFRARRHLRELLTERDVAPQDLVARAALPAAQTSARA